MCRTDGNRVVDCSINVVRRERVGDAELTAEETAREDAQIQQAQEQLLTVGRAIERYGSEGERAAWAGVAEIEINLNDDGGRGGSRDQYGAGKITLWGAALRGDIEPLRVTIVHEVFHGIPGYVASFMAAAGLSTAEERRAARRTAEVNVERHARRSSWQSGLVDHDTELRNEYIPCSRYFGRC